VTLWAAKIGYHTPGFSLVHNAISVGAGFAIAAAALWGARHLRRGAAESLTQLLLVLSVLILMLGAWISVDQFLNARPFHEWSTESGCAVPGSVIEWCKPETRARHAELARLYRQAAAQYAGLTIGLIAALWTTLYTLRWIVRGFRGPKNGQH